MNDEVLVYKVLEGTDWDRALGSGRYDGSVDDRRDGFIHLSTAGQLAGTLERHFRGRSGLVLVALPSAALGTRLRWEASRGGALFPHLYGPLQPELAAWTVPLANGPDGVAIVPDAVAATERS